MEAGAIINNVKMCKGLGKRLVMSINESAKIRFNQNQYQDIPQHDQNQSSRNGQTHGKAEKKDPPEENQDFGRRLFEFTEMEVDIEVEEALKKCKVGYTWFDESTEVLQGKLNDMGLNKFKVNSLSKRKFLIRKDDEESWEMLEATDLSVWFCKIRNYEEHDNIISRVTWLECRGLPMPGWKEENLRAFTSFLGRWIS